MPQRMVRTPSRCLIWLVSHLEITLPRTILASIFLPPPSGVGSTASQICSHSGTCYQRHNADAQISAPAGAGTDYSIS